MTPEELHRKHLTALIAGSLEEAEKVRERFKPLDRKTAVRHLRAAVAASLEFRFGPGAGLGARPVDHDEFTAFMAELRRDGDGIEPPLDHLAIESAVRSLYGEPHLLEPLGERRQNSAHYAVLRKQVDDYPWLRANPGHLIDRAKAIMTAWILG